MEDIIGQLRKEVAAIERPKQHSIPKSTIGAGKLEDVFQDGKFPTSSIHEFISYSNEAAASTNGFIAAIASKIIQGACLWITTRHAVFPRTLHAFGIDPARVIFIETASIKEALWAMEEGLRCKALTAVIGEIPDITFNQSRRLQLAVEDSCATGFLHRVSPKSENIVACLTKWRITPLATYHEDMPGVSFPRWKVDLVKVRNSKPSMWQIEWACDYFNYLSVGYNLSSLQTRKAG